MAIDPVATTGSTGGMYATTPTRTPKQTLDSETFMQLLVTQLRNQDPSSPMDTNQMISQTTQLAMMEKMTSMDQVSQENFGLQMRMAAASLVGHQVSYLDKTGASKSGIATAVSYAGSVPVVTIGSDTVALDSISGVVSTPAPTV